LKVKKKKIMKDLKFRHLFWVIPLFLLSYARVEYDAERTINKKFSANQISLLEIKNEYGNLEIKTWAKKEIAFEVKIQAQAENENMAKKLVNDSEIIFEQSNNRITAISKRNKTNIQRKWWKFWQDNNYMLNIHYIIYVPKEIDLNLENAYGNIEIENRAGDLVTELAYGKITTHNIKGFVDLDIKHGEAVMGYLGNTKIEAQYSEIKIERTGILKVNSRNSEISILEALDVNAYTKYDKYEFGKIDNFVNEGGYDEIEIKSARSVALSADYSELTVGNCEVYFEINMTHGEGIIKNTSSAFSKGVLEGSYTDYFISIAVPFSFHLKGKYTEIELPPVSVITENQISENTNYFSGQTGQKPTCSIIANLIYGSLNIK
jgi:hypothetical protein